MAVVFGFVLVLLNRQRRLHREIGSLKEAAKGKGSRTIEKRDVLAFRSISPVDMGVGHWPIRGGVMGDIRTLTRAS